MRAALQDLLRLGSANLGGKEGFEEELTRILAEWRADPATADMKVAAFAAVAGSLTAVAAAFATREPPEPSDDEPTDDEILQALRDIEIGVEELLRRG